MKRRDTIRVTTLAAAGLAASAPDQTVTFHDQGRSSQPTPQLLLRRGTTVCLSPTTRPPH